MDRRQAIKALGAAALAQLSSRELLSAARSAHAQLPAEASGARHLFKSLDPEQNELVVAVSELILPETDTPGAKAARVNEFVDVMLTEWFTEEERDRFYLGLQTLDEGERPFLELEESEQIEVLTRLEAQALEEEERAVASGGPVASSDTPANRPFFAVMKWLTLYGYYTSRVGMEQELHYEVFPGSYDGCVSIRPFEV